MSIPDFRTLEMATIMEKAQERYNALTPEERAKLHQEVEKKKEHKRIGDSVQQGRCPFCQHRLERGKKTSRRKDKETGGGRTWICNNCNKTFTLNLNKGEGDNNEM